MAQIYMNTGVYRGGRKYCLGQFVTLFVKHNKLSETVFSAPPVYNFYFTRI